MRRQLAIEETQYVLYVTEAVKSFMCSKKRLPSEMRDSVAAMDASIYSFSQGMAVSIWDFDANVDLLEDPHTANDLGRLKSSDFAALRGLADVTTVPKETCAEQRETLQSALRHLRGIGYGALQIPADTPAFETIKLH